MTRRIALLAVLVLNASASAQPVAPWSGQAVQHVEVLRGDRPAWLESRVGVQHRGARGALGVEVGRVERNDRANATVAADVYRVLSRRVYANVRAEVAPGADVVPGLSLLGEVYAGVGQGWEVTAGGRYLSVPGGDVPILLASANRTVGSVVVGVRTATALRPSTTVSASAWARYAPEEPGTGVPTRATLTLGQGQEAVLEAGGLVTVRRQFVVAVNGQRALAGPLGVLGGGAYTSDGTLSRWSVDAGLAVRF